MSQVLQLNSSLPGIFWVKPQNIDGKGYLVSHALTRAMAAGEKLKVLNDVVLSITINVVNCFFGQKRSTDMVLHHPAMLEDISRSVSIGSWHDQANVTVLGNPLCRNLIRIPLLVAKATKHRPAFGAAKTILPFKKTTLSSGLHLPATLHATDIGSGITGLSSGSLMTRHGAIRWVSVILLSIFGQVSGFKGKRVTALSALEFNGGHNSRRPTVGSFMLRLASLPAELARSFPLPRYMESSATIFASLVRMKGYALGLLARNAAKSLMLFGGSDRKFVAAKFASLDDGHVNILSGMNPMYPNWMSMSIAGDK